MAEVSKITLPSGTVYDIKDSSAREQITQILGDLSGAMHYIGVTTTPLEEGSSTSPISIDGEDYEQKAGDVVEYNDLEFAWSDVTETWHKFGPTGTFKALAFKDSASGSYTPSGSISQPSFSGSEGSVSVKGTPTGSVSISTGSGTANYTPSGQVSVTPTIEVNTTSVNSIEDVGTLPSCTFPNMTATVQNETLVLNWAEGTFNAGTLPTKGTSTTVATGIKSATATGSFVGTGVELTATFDGDETTSTGVFTPEGNVSRPTFTGNADTITVS